jgi:pSer/pThr/pTyr-binding forkhead associated (FHA) protein
LEINMSEATGKFLLKSEATGKERELTATVLVGRGVLDGIALTDSKASRHHATLTIAGSDAYVQDESRNGTFVNEQRITDKYKLKVGDHIRFADERFTLLETTPPQNETVIGFGAAEGGAAATPALPVNVEFHDEDHTVFCGPDQLLELERKSAEIRAANLAAAPVSVPCLIFSEAARTVPLTIGSAQTQEWIIGRHPGCDIRIASERVSSVHAKIVRTGDTWSILDALASNGLFVNNFQVGKQFLKAGDALRFGDVVCVFRLPPKAKARKHEIPWWLKYVAIAVGACLLAIAVIAALRSWR